MTSTLPALTLKVNFDVGVPPADDAETAQTVIQTKLSIYDLDSFIHDLRGEHIEYATKECLKKVAELELDEDGVADRLKLLKKAKYRGSRWCKSNLGPQPGWVACDEYLLRVTEERDGTKQPCTYYIKFGFDDGHRVVLQISFHV